MGTMVRETKVRYDGSKLAVVRKELGLSVRIAALEIGISYVTLSRIEKGCDTTEVMLQKICDHYKIPIDFVLAT